MFGLGMPELLVIFLVVFLLFGAKALPEIAKGLGQALKAFKKEMGDQEDQAKISPSIKDQQHSDTNKS